MRTRARIGIVAAFVTVTGFACGFLSANPTTQPAATRPATRAAIGQVGPGYVLLPVRGLIGVDITAEALQAGIDSAVELHPQFIVVFIDSDGGIVAEMSKMVDALHGIPSDIHVVAYVKKAYSAAAVLAMSCPQIVMKPDGVIGAAMPFQATRDGTPKDIDVKMKSAIEAQQRQWVIAAGHDDILLRGMMEMDLEIYLNNRNGQPVLSDSGPGMLVKKRNTILTLLASEAANYGLAQIGSKMAEVGQDVIGGAWHEASQLPWYTVLDEETGEIVEPSQETGSAEMKLRIKELNSEIATLQAKMAQDIQAMRRIQASARAQSEIINTECGLAIQNAKLQKDLSAIEQAYAVRDARLQQVADNCNQSVAPLAMDAHSCFAQISALRSRVGGLTSAILQFVN
jgi:ATP-dependent protease ClpP protease subunit